jgi:hypothetical protein
VPPTINQRLQDVCRLARSGDADQHCEPAVRAQCFGGLALTVPMPPGVSHARSRNRRRHLIRRERVPAIGNGCAGQGDEFILLVAVQRRRDLDLVALDFLPEQLGPLAVLHHATTGPVPGHRANVVGAREAAGRDEAARDRDTGIALADHGALGQHPGQMHQALAISVVHPFGPGSRWNRGTDRGAMLPPNTLGLLTPRLDVRRVGFLIQPRGVRALFLESGLLLLRQFTPVATLPPGPGPGRFLAFT